MVCFQMVYANFMGILTRRSYKILEPMFEDFIISSEGQDILSHPKDWETLLNMIPSEGILCKRNSPWFYTNGCGSIDIRHSLHEQWANEKTSFAPRQKWSQVRDEVQRELSRKRKKVQ